jgi:hypothetical protein
MEMAVTILSLIEKWQPLYSRTIEWLPVCPSILVNDLM